MFSGFSAVQQCLDLCPSAAPGSSLGFLSLRAPVGLAALSREAAAPFQILGLSSGNQNNQLLSFGVCGSQEVKAQNTVLLYNSNFRCVHFHPTRVIHLF